VRRLGSAFQPMWNLCLACPEAGFRVGYPDVRTSCRAAPGRAQCRRPARHILR